MNETTRYPIYGDAPAKPGMYLGLLHGRDHPNAQMDGWGFNGPLIGPLRWYHTTYLHDIKIEFESDVDAALYFDHAYASAELGTHGDLLILDDKYYGDWTVFYVPLEDCKRPVDTFRRTERLDRLAPKHIQLKSFS